MYKKIILNLLIVSSIQVVCADDNLHVVNKQMRAKYQELKKLGVELLEQDNLLAALKQKMEQLFADAKSAKKQQLISEDKSLKDDASLDAEIEQEITTLFNDYFDLSKDSLVSISEPFNNYFTGLLEPDEIGLLKFYAVKYTFDLMDFQESLDRWDRLSDDLINFGRDLMAKDKSSVKSCTSKK